MPSIFISYRRADSQATTDRIHEHLARAFGADNVFQDVENIGLGADFRRVIQEQVAACDVLLVIVGSQWANITDATGNKRLDNPDDFVRIEVEAGLNRGEAMLVVPVLVQGATMPDASDLPASLGELLYRNAATIRGNPFFNDDVAWLARHIKRTNDVERRLPFSPWIGGGVVIALLALIALVFTVVSSGNGDATNTPASPPSQTPPPTDVVDVIAETETPDPTTRQPTADQQSTQTQNALVTQAAQNQQATQAQATANQIALIEGLTQDAVALATAQVQMALTPIARNANWTPVEHDFDGVAMVLVPAGCFMMGSEDGEPDEQPVHQQCFDEPFWIDKFEVTQADFARLGGTQIDPPDFPGDFGPVEDINWFEARDFCQLRGTRLPTEREWEYAARGPDHLVYPWGNEFVADNVVSSDYLLFETTNPVGSRPGGVSWVGAHDLSSNVWEWLSTIYDNDAMSGEFRYPYVADDGREDLSRTNILRVLHGGSWDNSSDLMRAANRGAENPSTTFEFIGFRCARDGES